MNYSQLYDILNTFGVSGAEMKIGDKFIAYVRDVTDCTYVDSMNNAYAYIKGGVGNQSVMIEAHCDEIGFQVLFIDVDGFIYLRKNGGIDEQCIPGSVVRIFARSGECIVGVIGKKPIHLQTSEERKKKSNYVTCGSTQDWTKK